MKIVKKDERSIRVPKRWIMKSNIMGSLKYPFVFLNECKGINY